MKVRRIFLTLLLLGGAAGLYGLHNISQKPMEIQAEQRMDEPSVTTTENFFQVPWGVSKTEVLDLLKIRNWEPAPKGFYATSTLTYKTSYAGYPAYISFDFKEADNTDYSFFYQGSLSIRKQNAPIEELYWQMHKELTERYGPTPERGYPPLRNSASEKPWGPGSGAIWEVKTSNGQILEIETQLDLSDTGFLKLKYRNITVERKFKNLLWPTPAGDPIQAASDLKGFMDIPWGSTPEQFRQGMGENGFFIVAEDTSPRDRKTHLKCNNGRYADHPIDRVDGYFNHDVLYFVSVSIRGDESDNGDAVYNHVKSYLESQYGMPTETKDYEGDTIHLWQFPLEGFKPNYIMLHRNRAMIMIAYMNPALEDKLNNL